MVTTYRRMGGLFGLFTLAAAVLAATSTPCALRIGGNPRRRVA
jgi:hypothetical protein